MIRYKGKICDGSGEQLENTSPRSTRNKWKGRSGDEPLKMDFQVSNVNTVPGDGTLTYVGDINILLQPFFRASMVPIGPGHY